MKERLTTQYFLVSLQTLLIRSFANISITCDLYTIKITICIYIIGIMITVLNKHELRFPVELNNSLFIYAIMITEPNKTEITKFLKKISSATDLKFDPPSDMTISKPRPLPASLTKPFICANSNASQSCPSLCSPKGSRLNRSVPENKTGS